MEVVVYSKNGCSACEQAKMLLKNKGIGFTVRNCDEDFDAYEFIIEKGHRSFPVIYTHDNVLFANSYKALVEKLS